jgi:hypothetical protein
VAEKVFLIACKQDPVLFSVFTESNERVNSFNTELKALTDAASDLFDKLSAERSSAWTKIKARLKELTLLPENFADSGLELSIDHGVIFMAPQRSAKSQVAEMVEGILQDAFKTAGIKAQVSTDINVKETSCDDPDCIAHNQREAH